VTTRDTGPGAPHTRDHPQAEGQAPSAVSDAHPPPPSPRPRARDASTLSSLLTWITRRRWTIAGSAFAAVAVVLLLHLLFPPDLTRFQDRSTVVLDRDGRILRAFLATDGIWRLSATPDDVDPLYLEILKIYEDRRFDEHWGVDPLAAARAFWQLLSEGRVVSGASTLTMQTARLLEPGPRGVPAKLRQVVRALQLEATESKDKILTYYLTLAPFGGNLEGVRAASIAYFGKEPVELTLAQAALLVALPQSPERLRPDRFPEAARAGRRKVLERLLDAGFIDQKRFEEALEEPIPTARRNFPFHAPRLARSLADRLEAVNARGGAVGTYIDPRLQYGIEGLVGREIESEAFEDGASIAVVVVENRTRELRAYLGGADFWAEEGQVDVARSYRSPGSALKPFIYGLGFDDLVIHPQTLIEDRPTSFGDYAPRNFSGGFAGTVTVREALQRSLNVPAVAVLDQVDPGRFAATLNQAGARLALPDTVERPSLPIALGGVGITLFDLTELYVGLANGGRMEPIRVATSDPEEDPTRLMGEVAAWYVTDILQDAPLPDGWGQARNLIRGRNIAFKTGTSYGYRDAWAVGYSRAYTVGVWVGRPDGSPRPGRFGRNDAAPLMLRVFGLLPDEAPGPWEKPANVIDAADRDDLPPAMRRFAVEPRLTPAEDLNPPPQIAYPPAGAIVEPPPPPLDPEEPAGLALKVNGGSPPFRWIVNGQLLPPTPLLEQTYWEPDGEGFAKITVVDSEGRSQTVVVRIRRTRG